jgi:parallel beta-helix repeat protein
MLYGCGPIPFVTPGVEQSPEVPEGLEIELEPIINLELAQTKGSTRYIPSDTEIGTWDPVNRIYTLTQNINEGIVIDEDNLTLDGAGYTITGSGSGYGVYLNQRSIVTVKNCVLSKFFIGICLSIGSSNTLTDNTINSNSYGIYLNSGSSNTLTNNITNNNSCGIFLNSGTSNTLTNNITNNNSYGIYLNYSSSNTLTSNTPNNNYYGIYLNSCSSNTLTKNTINNNQSGIFLYNCNLNKVYNNNFINNSTQAYVNYGSDNEFFLDKLAGGNYWSGWTSPDDDGDYFVDYSYVFLGGQDDFPWICQDGWKNIRPIADAGYDKKVLVGETVQFDGSGSYDTDGIIVSYDWVFGDGTNGSGMIVNHIYNVAGIYTVTLVISDDGDLKGTDTAEIMIQTPAEATGDLITTIESFELSKGVQQSLTMPLKKAINALENFHEQGTIGKLNGFIHHVGGLQNSKKLTKEQANTLIAAAQRIINSIQ